eukprot:6194899-Pleurochrysis_carterae.AAC.1
MAIWMADSASGDAQDARRETSRFYCQPHRNRGAVLATFTLFSATGGVRWLNLSAAVAAVTAPRSTAVAGCAAASRSYYGIQVK